ncbi:L,D-transpeptidase family protein [Pseudalkalibacillus sp. R45]
MKIGLKKVIVGLLVVCFMFFFMQQPASASTGSFIIINKSNNQLAYFENNKLMKVFKVATGKQPTYTPEGRFKIVNKIVNRPYYTGKISGGDPRNPLGNRWLGLNARGTWGTTYAIHGNNNARSIGQYVSAGCIRMYNDEVQWLFSKVPVNTPVIITTSGKSFTALASANGFNVKSGAVVAVSTTNLKKGSRGAEVKNVQQRLTELGYSTKGIDGIFGKNTDAAVRKFQKTKKLKVDGVVGPATKKALGKM